MSDERTEDEQTIVDTLADCISSFGLDGRRAYEAAEFIVSADSGLVVSEVTQ